MKKYLLLVLLAIIVLAGCDGKQTPTASTPFIGGSTGMIIDFLEDAPPREVYDAGGFPFPVVVKLTNDGEWDVMASDVQVKISGIDPAEFGLSPQDMVQHPDEDMIRTYKDAEGNVIPGVITYVNFPEFNYGGEIAGNIEFPIRADVCYTYGTRALSKLCIKEDLYDSSEDSFCQVNEDKVVYSSKAPLQITDLKQSARGKEKIGFTFTIAHKGNGNVFELGSVCNTEGITYENKVWVEVETGMAGLECTGLTGGTGSSGFVTMYTGERKITCTQDADSMTDYEKPVTITLTYDYKDDKRTELLLKHTITG